MATCSEDMSAEQTQKVQQDQQPEFAHQSIKRQAVEDYGDEQSNTPSAIAGGEASTPAAHGEEAHAPSAAESQRPVDYEVYGLNGEVLNG
ncbi:unnamed protein product [Macrosiphum euphorbiae]|uniref:Uncharacterized protein n=1 Tax=Macrosiphum euphorbiae TaxID=13131 RepID=A0AAV0WTT1_9HEMI|nr:unnamed protein product [Macrosiphum euphorbiae]